MNRSFLAVAASVLCLGAISAAHASATDVLCKVKSQEGGIPASCPAEQVHHAGSKFGFEGGTEFTSGFDNVKCSTAIMVENTAESGAPIPVKFDKYELSKCTDGFGTACTAAASGLPWEEGITWISGTWNGNVSLKKRTLQFTCKVFGNETNCIYETGETGAVELRGGNPAELVFNKLALSKKTGSNGLCSSTATYSGTLKSPPEYYEEPGSTSIWVEPK